MKKKLFQTVPSRVVKNGGFILLLIVLTLLAIGGTILLVGLGSGLSNADRSLAVRASADDTLGSAKLALLGYFVRETSGGNGYRLGNFPTPDSLADAQYNGSSDGDRCLSNSGTGLPPAIGSNANKRCLGKIPWKDLALDFGTVDANDPLGRVPWLGISANLSYWDQCLNVLNSEILNFSYTTFNCPVLPTLSTSLPHPWLTVRNETGAILSNRVAAVLILPGAPITTETRSQSRTVASPGQASDYLDSIRLPLGCSASCAVTYDNAGLNNEFIAIPLGTRYPNNSEDVAKRNQNVAFNDVVLYITIDELMPLLERRVLAEMASALRDVSGAAPKKNIGYPWAAPFVSPVNYASFNSQPLSLVGLFPFFVQIPSPLPFGVSLPTYQTTLDWTVAGLTNPAKTCVQVQSTPSVRWMNSRQNITSAVGATGSLPFVSSSCTWNGTSALSCSGTSTVPLTSTYTLFSTSSRCNTGSPTSGTASYTRQRTINLTIDSTCSTPGATYAVANGTQPQRWTWSCSSALNTFTVDVSDVFTSTPLAVTGSASFNAAGRSVTATSRYQPVMPYWFYQNEWYKTAFYTLSPSKAPSAGSPDCGAATTLTVGGTAVSTAVAVLAGSRLPNLPATPTQTRPSGVIANYLEGLNATAATNCVYASAGEQVSSGYNDQLIIFEP